MTLLITHLSPFLSEISVWRLAFISRLKFSTMLSMQLSSARQRVWDWMACRQIGHSSFFLRHCLMQWLQKLWAQFRMTAWRRWQYRGVDFLRASETDMHDVIKGLKWDNKGRPPTSMKSSEQMMHWSSFSRTSVTCVTTSSFWALAFSFSSYEKKDEEKNKVLLVPYKTQQKIKLKCPWI